jgi:hypothetical protein
MHTAFNEKKFNKYTNIHTNKLVFCKQLTPCNTYLPTMFGENVSLLQVDQVGSVTPLMHFHVNHEPRIMIMNFGGGEGKYMSYAMKVLLKIIQKVVR